MSIPAIEIFDPTQLREGPLLALYTYWASKKDGDRLPTWSDIDPIEIPSLLPNITVFGIEKGPQRVKVRLQGTDIVSQLGVDYTNDYLDEVANMDQLQERALTCSESRTPFFRGNLQATWSKRDFKKYSVLALPISSDGIEVERIIYMVVFD